MSTTSDDSASPSLDAIFDDDYLYFYERVQTPERCERETDFIIRTLALGAGDRLLDAGCGYGRIASRAAARGLHVVGVDRSSSLLARAQAEANVLAETRRPQYIECDLRTIEFKSEFDGAVSWFSSYGFLPPQEDARILERLAQALRPGGRLLLETVRRSHVRRTLRSGRSVPVIVSERGRDAIVDRVRSADRGRRIAVDRLICRRENVRRESITSWAYDLDDLTGVLIDSGFSEVRECEIPPQDADLVTIWALVVVATR